MAWPEHSVEKAHEYEVEDKQKAMIHISSMMVSFVLLVVITIAIVVRNKYGSMTMAVARGYNSLELSDMDSTPQSEYGAYVPISSNL